MVEQLRLPSIKEEKRKGASIFKFNLYCGKGKNFIEWLYDLFF